MTLESPSNNRMYLCMVCHCFPRMTWHLLLSSDSQMTLSHPCAGLGAAADRQPGDGQQAAWGLPHVHSCLPSLAGTSVYANGCAGAFTAFGSLRPQILASDLPGMPNQCFACMIRSAAPIAHDYNAKITNLP